MSLSTELNNIDSFGKMKDFVENLAVKIGTFGGRKFKMEGKQGNYP